MGSEKPIKDLNKVFGSMVDGITRAGHRVDQGFKGMVDKSADVAKVVIDPTKWKKKQVDANGNDMPPAGYLSVWEGRLGRWKLRFFSTATPCALECYKTAAKAGHCWKIDLHEATVFEVRGSKKQFQLVSETGSYFFKTGSRKALAAWIQAIQVSILQGVEKKQLSTIRSLNRSGMYDEVKVVPPQTTEERIQHLVAARMQLRLTDLKPILLDMEEQLHALEPGFESDLETQLAAVQKPQVKELAMQRSDSFASAVSDMDGRELSESWYQMVLALRDTLRKEVYRLVELEEENLALRSALRNTKAGAGLGSSAYNVELLTDESTNEMPDNGDVAMLMRDVQEDSVLPQTTIQPPAFDDDDVESTSSRIASDEHIGESSSVVAAGVRSALPVDQPTDRGFSIWSVLKNAIGKDLSRITLPATINEPLSALQRIAEELEYRHLLEKAVKAKDSTERLMYVAVFAISSYSSAILRVNKPFNPLLGETYEWNAPQGDCRFVCEQVSHHPPISCFWSEGGSGAGTYNFYGEAEMRSKFWGKSIEMFPAGTCYLRLPALNETYSWNKATTNIHNIILGKMWVEWAGDITVRNRATGEWAQLNLPRCRGQLARRGVVEGVVYNRLGDPVYAISGSYMHKIHVQLSKEAANARGVPAQPECVYTCHELPPRHAQQYEMTAMAVTLNELTDALKEVLPPTDSRYRTDQGALEAGRWDEATSEKLRLEEKQRTIRKLRKDSGVEYRPAYFDFYREGDKGSMVSTESDDQEPCWKWNNSYMSRDWGHSYDIYSNDAPKIGEWEKGRSPSS